MRDLSDKVAVVTGAGRGIGFALASVLVRRGMRVVLSDVEPARPERVAEGLHDLASGTAVGMVCDVSDAAQVDDLAKKIVERHGRIDLLCNNAGVVSGGPTWDISLDTWRRVLNVNVLGAVHGIHSFVPLMMENPDGGHVINVGSMASVLPVRGIAPYNVSKHGLLALSETLLADLRAAGSAIGVTVVMPGRVATGIGLPSGQPAPELDESEPGILSAEAVAEHVVTAVEEDRLYVFTHPDRLEGVRARFAAIVDG